MKMKIFVGTSPGKDDAKAEAALEYSLRKNSPVPMDIHFMRNNDDPDNFFGGFDNSTWWTPFSFLRWTIPEFCEYKGRALYLDVDQLNFRDISDLYVMDLKGKAAAVRPDGRTCVMLMDCKKMREIIPESAAEIKANPAAVHQRVSNDILHNCVYYDERWNCLDGEKRRADDIWHLHFTEMRTQPWQPQWPHETWARKGKKYEAMAHPRSDLTYIWKSIYKESQNV